MYDLVIMVRLDRIMNGIRYNYMWTCRAICIRTRVDAPFVAILTVTFFYVQTALSGISIEKCPEKALRRF